MNDKRAEEWIPQELLIKLQEYVDGEYLYIPRKSNHHKTWGEKNGYKKVVEKRIKYIKGLSLSVSSECFDDFLT